MVEPFGLAGGLMPSSAFNHIPTIGHYVGNFQPTSILDIGVGFGKWGYLFREITDISKSQDNPPQYHRENWQCRIDGVEGFPQYITEIQRLIYNNIYIGDVRDVIKTLGTYDVIFAGDVIEHLTKEDGKTLIREAMKHANKAFVLSTPAYEMAQEDINDNPLEIHKSQWSAAEFQALGREFGGARTLTVQSKILVAIIVNPGVPMPRRVSYLKSFVRARLINLLGERRYKKLGGI
jgi:hypothetical protein